MTSSTRNDWIYTQMRGDKIKYEWTIKDYNSLTEMNGEVINSSVFPANNNEEQWKLRFYPRGKKEKHCDWISLYLRPMSISMLGITVKFEISISRSMQVLAKKVQIHRYKKIKSHGTSRLIERSKLSSEDVSQNEITISCSIELLGTFIHSSSISLSQLSPVSFKSKKRRLNEDFHLLYNNPEFSDFTIISRNEEFPSHKNILASRSPVFRAMFGHKGMEENVRNEIRIDNIEPAVVKGLLEFIYTDHVVDIEELAFRLLPAAEQYAISGLKILCEETIYKRIDDNNAAEILVLADHYHADQLKRRVKQYIVAHRFTIVNSEAFKMTDMPLSLAKELMCTLTFLEDESSDDEE